MTPEISTYISILRDLRAEVVKWCDGLPAAALNWRPLDQTTTDINSLYVMATHLSGSEAWWIHQIIGGADIGRNRDAEFVATGSDFASLKARLAAVAAQSEAVLNTLSDADLNSERDNTLGRRTVRWCILHVIEHTARHVGHIELTRQLWDKTK